MKVTGACLGFLLVCGLTANAPAAAKGAPSALLPPAQIYAPRATNAGPAQVWYFATDPKTVSRLILGWLATAKPVSVTAPAHPYRGLVIDYDGPARLYFVTANDEQAELYPTYSIVKAKRPAGVTASPGATYSRVQYVPGVVTYTVGDKTLHLRSVALWSYLDHNTYETQFTEESWTPAEGRAIRAVQASRLGEAVRAFPDTPSTAPLVRTRRGAKVVYATATTEASSRGEDVSLVFYETWDGGAKQHMWRFLVGPEGRVIRHLSRGPEPPARA